MSSVRNFVEQGLRRLTVQRVKQARGMRTGECKAVHLDVFSADEDILQQ